MFCIFIGVIIAKEVRIPINTEEVVDYFDKTIFEYQLQPREGIFSELCWISNPQLKIDYYSNYESLAKDEDDFETNFINGKFTSTFPTVSLMVNIGNYLFTLSNSGIIKKFELDSELEITYINNNSLQVSNFTQAYLLHQTNTSLKLIIDQRIFNIVINNLTFEVAYINTQYQKILYANDTVYVQQENQVLVYDNAFQVQDQIVEECDDFTVYNNSIYWISNTSLYVADINQNAQDTTLSNQCEIKILQKYDNIFVNENYVILTYFNQMYNTSHITVLKLFGNISQVYIERFFPQKVQKVIFLKNYAIVIGHNSNLAINLLFNQYAFNHQNFKEQSNMNLPNVQNIQVIKIYNSQYMLWNTLSHIKIADILIVPLRLKCSCYNQTVAKASPYNYTLRLFNINCQNYDCDINTYDIQYLISFTYPLISRERRQITMIQSAMLTFCTLFLLGLFAYYIKFLITRKKLNKMIQDDKQVSIKQTNETTLGIKDL
ncbi:hypothetical protein pb186bvf_019628 [Paramecium bursaria]